MAKIKKSTIQDHFQFGKFTSSFMMPPQDDDDLRTVTVTDTYGKTSKASKNELYVSQALETLDLEYQFQVSIAGGRAMSFGIVLDFMVFTVPMPTPLWVHGEYFHMGARRQKDLRQQATVLEYHDGNLNEAVEIWGDQSDNKERALASVRRKLA